MYVCYPMFILKCVRRDSNLVNSILQCCFHMLPNDLPQMFVFLFDRHGCPKQISVHSFYIQGAKQTAETV